MNAMTSIADRGDALPPDLRAALADADALEAYAAAASFAAALAELSLPLARALTRGALAAADDARAVMGRDMGLLDAVPAYVPDFLKTRSDQKRDLWNAWRALDAADRAAFLRWASRGRAAA